MPVTENIFNITKQPNYHIHSGLADHDSSSIHAHGYPYACFTTSHTHELTLQYYHYHMTSVLADAECAQEYSHTRLNKLICLDVCLSNVKLRKLSPYKLQL